MAGHTSGTVAIAPHTDCIWTARIRRRTSTYNYQSQGDAAAARRALKGEHGHDGRLLAPLGARCAVVDAISAYFLCGDDAFGERNIRAYWTRHRRMKPTDEAAGLHVWPNNAWSRRRGRLLARSKNNKWNPGDTRAAHLELCFSGHRRLSFGQSHWGCTPTCPLQGEVRQCTLQGGEDEEEAGAVLRLPVRLRRCPECTCFLGVSGG